jgi:hypothetical protein
MTMIKRESKADPIWGRLPKLRLELEEVDRITHLSKSKLLVLVDELQLSLTLTIVQALSLR